MDTKSVNWFYFLANICIMQKDFGCKWNAYCKSKVFFNT